MADISASQYYFSVRNTCHKDVCHHLSALRKKIKLLSRNDSFWQEELERVKKRKDEEWQEKIKEIEEENRKLRQELQRMNGHLPSVMDKGVRLDETENEVYKLNKLLSLKCITINRLQNDLAHYSKIIVELEKSYALHCLQTGKGENHISSR